MNLPHGYHTVAWYEQFKHHDFVFMRRGTGETGWWHQHEGEADYGGNPMDYKRTMGAYKCRTCGATLSQDAATKARARADQPGDGQGSKLNQHRGKTCATTLPVLPVPLDSSRKRG